MTYQYYELYNTDNTASDVVLYDEDGGVLFPVFVHYAYTIPAPGNKSQADFLHSRGIPNTQAVNTIQNNNFYFPGKSGLSENTIGSIQTDTTVRLGALEALANTFSGRITASEKDPFPHQLSLQQFVANNYEKIERLLIADEVGLGKTIEAGLILRDCVLRNPNLSCLYLTRGGLREDVRLKLSSVLGHNTTVVEVIGSMLQYGQAGQQSIRGVKIGSMDAAARYVNNQKRLPAEIAPDIVIVDECHYCSATDINLTPPFTGQQVTQTYKAIYKIIDGSFWANSTSPKLVILMSATPFRSQAHFSNLLKLLTHRIKSIPNAYSENVESQHLINTITNNEDLSSAVIWRQQDQVRNWSGKRFFPNLTIHRPNHESEIPLLPANPQYLNLLEEIKQTLRVISANHSVTFGGFSIARFNQILLSSSVAGACYIFRWCVQHSAKWTSQVAYNADQSESTVKMRNLLKQISTTLQKFDSTNDGMYAKVNFASDKFSFEPNHFQGNIPRIYVYKRELSDNENSFIAEPNELEQLLDLGLNLLNFTANLNNPNSGGIENTKLNWLRQMLDTYPNNKFLIFAESLQTCTIISSSLGTNRCGVLLGTMGESERKSVIEKFFDVTNQGLQALIATSCADEGFDFQVANHIVHWDLSSSPATLMQRNGRLARLGQTFDVNAYYLIIPDTFEDRREQLLISKFRELGITDEILIAKILGQVDVSEFDDNPGNIDILIDKAVRQNNEMTEHFQQLNRHLDCRYILDRNVLLKRLKLWKKLGFPFVLDHLNITESSVEWLRPIFAPDGTTTENTITDTIEIRQNDEVPFGRLIFDPEFAVFGQGKARGYTLAGLKPWSKIEKNHISKIRPLNKISDPIGYLCYKLARTSKADFAFLSRKAWLNVLDDENNTEGFTASVKYLLITTHPLKEVENDNFYQGYISFQGFNDLNENNPFQPITKLASAELIHKLITALEKYSTSVDQRHLSSKFNTDKGNIINVAKQMANWLTNNVTFKASIFAPIPVALITIID